MIEDSDIFDGMTVTLKGPVQKVSMRKGRKRCNFYTGSHDRKVLRFKAL